MKKHIILKFIIGIALVLIGALILYIISRKSVNSEVAQLTSGEAQYKKGMELFIAKKIPDASAQLTQAYGLGYEKAAAPLGSCYLEMGKMTEAERYLTEALNSIQHYTPSNQKIIYNHLAISQAALGKTAAAKANWEKAAELGSEDAKLNLLKLARGNIKAVE
jgi:tetratricopeptide (TPR) repeat protein